MDATSLGIRPPANPKGPPFSILKYPFLVTDPKILLKASLAPIYANFERGARAEKAFFW